jgi:hypothetical protein
MVIEMRTYRLKPNTRGRFLEIFRSQSIPEHRRLGMTILGPARIDRRSGHILFHARIPRFRLPRVYESTSSTKGICGSASLRAC